MRKGCDAGTAERHNFNMIDSGAFVGLTELYVHHAA
jgi:hypothetical protein